MRVAAASRLLAWRRSRLADLERMSRETRAVDSELAYAWRLYRLGERRLADECEAERKRSTTRKK
jgi:hypothetical protein